MAVFFVALCSVSAALLSCQIDQISLILTVAGGRTCRITRPKGCSTPASTGLHFLFGQALSSRFLCFHWEALCCFPRRACLPHWPRAIVCLCWGSPSTQRTKPRSIDGFFVCFAYESFGFTDPLRWRLWRYYTLRRQSQTWGVGWQALFSWMLGIAGFSLLSLASVVLFR